MCNAAKPIPEFKIKVKNSDFRVREISLIPENIVPEQSIYTYLSVEKNNLTTFQATDRLAKMLNLDKHQVSASGLKDEQAITTQAVSIQKILSYSQLDDLNRQLIDQDGIVRISSILGYGNTPLSPRALHGNEFDIVIRNLTLESASRLRETLEKNRYQFFVNYYDEQRFGTPESCHNTHLIGKYILDQNWEKAFEEYLKSGNYAEEEKEIESSRSPKEAILEIDQRKREFFVSAYNSYLWNKKLDSILDSIDADCQKVDFPFIGQINIPFSDTIRLINPLPVTAYEYNWEQDKKRTALKTRPSQIITAVYLTDYRDDELFAGKKSATISFILPTGCYATMLIKQLLLK
jgi:tRNA pseudouridine13 synthase